MRALALVAALVLAGCAGGPAGTSEDVHEASFRLSPHPIRGWTNETDVRLEAGETGRWSFEASSPIGWDVHTHEGERVVVIENGTSARHEGEIVAERAGTYSIYLANRPGNGPVDVTVRVRGQFELAR